MVLTRKQVLKTKTLKEFIMSTAENWTLLFRSPSQVQVALLKGKLHEVHIPAVEVNKKDSMYGVFGEIDLMVPKDNLVEASEILRLFNQDEDTNP